MNFFIPKACFFTGHRAIKEAEAEKIKVRLNEEIEKKIQDGVLEFIAGGATGFDMMAEQAVLDMRAKYPDIKLRLYLPCINQAEEWNEHDRRRYFDYLVRADEVYYVSREKYTDGCMKKRNQAMVNASVCGIAYMVSDRSGTSQTIRMAEEKGIDVVKISV